MSSHAIVKALYNQKCSYNRTLLSRNH